MKTKEQLKEYRRNYYILNKEKILKRSQEWKQNNKEKVKEQSKGRYLKYKEKTLITTRAWAKANPDKVKAASNKAKKGNPQRNLYNNAKGRAKKNGIDFTIVKEDIIIPEYCPLLSVKLNSWGEKDYCPSLDRIDNTKGYTPDNIWVISFKANRMKNTATLQELRIFAENIIKDVMRFD